MINDMKIWVISDTHFNHTKLVEMQERPGDFNELIISNWNKLVNDHDLVIHLGDVILGKDSSLPDIMSRLNGTKIMCRGNHDNHPWTWYIERGFSFCTDYFIYKDIAFSHVPLTPLPKQSMDKHTEPCVLNIHGHFHKQIHRGNPLATYDPSYNYNYYSKNLDKYHLVQIEDYLRPVMLDTIRKEHGI